MTASIIQSERRSFLIRRVTLFVLALAIAALGLAMRGHPNRLPVFLALYAPDALWAMLVFVLAALLAPRLPASQTALIALAFAYSIEFSQLYQAPWINGLRATRLGGLILGHGFLWTDLVCYTVGIGVGVALDAIIRAQMWRTRHAVDGNG